jgi:hypothetical protein
VRNAAFRGLVILFSLLLMAVLIVSFLNILLLWLPDVTLLSLIGDLEPAGLLF